MEHSLTTYLWFFTIYAFLGWWLEVAFQALTKGKFINRGFLNGPVCPIYGFGMSILLLLLSPLADNFILLFIGSVILTSALEFITGYVLEKIFDKKWWDYTNTPYNIKGYISLSFSLMWGIAAVFAIHIIHPLVFGLVSLLDNRLGSLLIALFITYFVADFIVTLFAILKISRRLRLLDDMAARLRVYSDGFGENVCKRVSAVKSVSGKVQDRAQDIKSGLDASTENNVRIQELKARFDKLIQDKGFVHKRLEKAYPNIKKRLSKFENFRKPK